MENSLAGPLFDNKPREKQTEAKSMHREK